jgi:hypothetical protein
VLVPSVALLIGVGLFVWPVELVVLVVSSASSVWWGGLIIRVSFVLSRKCEVPTRDVVFLLALFRISSFFFFLISTIVFCIRGSFVVIDCGWSWRWDKLVSCGCSTSNLFFVGIASARASCFFMFSFFSSVAYYVLFSSWLNERISISVFFRLPDSPLFLVTRFGCRLSFRVLWEGSLTLLFNSLVVFCVICFLLVAFFVEFRVVRFLPSASLSVSPIFLFILF